MAVRRIALARAAVVIATLFGALPILVADVSGREELDGLSGADTWAGRKSHPARVNSVMDAANDSNLISLRGEWDFVMTTLFQGRRNSHDVPFFLTSGEWKSARKIVVPGCWEAQGVGEQGEGGRREGSRNVRPDQLRALGV